MEEMLQEHSWMKKIRGLTHALIISGALNIGFFTTFCVMAIKNVHRKAMQSQPVIIQSPKVPVYVSSDSMELLSEYFELSYDKLLEELLDKRLVEDGYAKRDYALACLVTFHYFDISKALSGVRLQTRTLEFIHKEGGERAKIDIFAGLDDAHFDAIVGFAKLETWPLTPAGLYAHIKRMKLQGKIPSSLQDAFYLTPHFHMIWRLFNHWEPGISVEVILKMISDADWDYIDRFYQEIYKTNEFNEESRRKFLMALIDYKSEMAAKLLLDHDRDFALSKLDDNSILYLLSQLPKSSSKPEAFARQLLVSVRSEDVHFAAGKKLYELSHERAPDPYDHQQALIRFLPNFFHKSDFMAKQQVQEKELPAPLKIHKKYHLVVKGDNLWKIGSIYKVSVKELVKINNLSSSTVIKPGMKLEIP